MIRFSALNESDSNDSDYSSQPEVVTREAQEDEAFSLYNKALQLQNENNHEKAEELYEQLLQTKFLIDAIPSDENNGVFRPNLQLKYSTYKNLANIAIHKQDNEKAMESFLNALSLDSSDVVVWYKIGITALKIHNYPLSRLAFQEGLKLNSDHWPCLDNLITLLYALNDYATCLYFIAQAFEKEPYYTKGLAIRDQIFHEQPSLRKDSGDLFKKCDEVIYKITYEKDEAEKFIEESLQMRKIKRELSAIPEPQPLSFTKPLTSFTWKCLGNCLVALYDHVWDAAPKLSFSCPVNTSKYLTESQTPSENVCLELSGPVLAIKDQGIISSDSSTVNAPLVDMSTTSDIIPNTLEIDDVLIHLPMDQCTTPYSEGIMGDISRRMPKRKRILMEFGDPLSKRRSARVRNTGVSKKQDINYCQILEKFLPKSLKMESAETPKTLIPLSLNVEKISNEFNQVTSCNLSANEEDDVKLFLQTNDGFNVLDIMYNYLVILGEKQRTTWPVGLIEEFITIYGKIRNHFTKPSVICQKLKNETIKSDAMFTLVFSELKLDSWHIARLKSTAHSPMCWNNPLVAQLIPDFPGKYFREDLEFLVQLSVRKDVLQDDWLDFFMRVMWLRARFLSMQGQMEFAIDSFDRITSCIQNGEIKYSENEFRVTIPNCQVENVITLDQIQTQLDTLQRCQSLEEVNCLFEAKEYQQVVELLTVTFNQAQSKKVSNKNIPERRIQLELLQESLWQLQNIQECLRWSELAFNESIQQYLTLTEKQQKNNWITTICKLLKGLEKCLNKDVSCLANLEQDGLVRFSHNLIQIISIQMDLPDSNTTFDSVYPWILLHKIIELEEKKDINDSYLPGVPASLMVLYNAHEFLGRRSWCCNSDGSLLLLYSEILLKELDDCTIESPHPYKEDLELSLEQCYYCLYSHPQKKSKAKHLHEHNASSITLTIERAVPIFNYFKPKPLPEFDSHKANTVSAEFENLLKRIKSLIPSQENEETILANVNAYIDATSDEFPRPQQEKSKRTVLVDELYYLLADYYFKTKEFSKAIRYYVTDICFNPERMDSWAGMALARSSQLEQLIHSVGSANEDKTKKKSSGYLYRKATCALRCFRGAVTINRHNTTLWIEYGSVSYMLHSHVSRQLKQKEYIQLSDETIEKLTKKKEDLLSTAEECFKSANECDSNSLDEEEWLHNYMLGKIAEKQRKSLEISLKHYSLAAALLHEKGARYPRKIQYHNPPDLAMEALEVFYRTHAATLKYLLIHEDEKLDVEFCRTVYGYLKGAAASPFASFQEKSRYSASLSSSEIEELSPMSLLHPGEHPSKPKSKLRRLKFEHDYFRRKRKDSSTTDDFDLEARKNSADSSSESLDSATVKDVVNNIISVVSEKYPDEKQSHSLIIVLGDTKIRKINTIVKSDEQTTAIIQAPLSESVTQDSEVEIVPTKETNTSSNSSNKPEKLDETKRQDEKKSIEISTETQIVTKDEIIPDQTVLVKTCLDALKQCLQRFPQHYKSLYRLAYFHSRSKYNKQLQWSRDFLLGRSIPWQQLSYMPSQGLFNERKNSNLFNGIWRIPNDEIDRPGSFCSHMYRSVKLLGEVLLQLKDFFVLANLLTQLYRTPEAGKKFLRDNDRLIVANLIQSLTITALLEEMNKLVAPPKFRENEDKVIKHIILVSKIWHILTKISEKISEVNKLLEDVYRIYLKCLDIPEPPCLLEQALKFCQQQLSLTRTLKMPSITQIDLIRPSQSLICSGLDIERKIKTIHELYQLERGQIKLPTQSETTRIDYIHSSQIEKSRTDLKEKLTLITNKPAAPNVDTKSFANVSRSSLPNSSETKTQSTHDSTKKNVWPSNSIPVEGVVIGSMTITPVGASASNALQPEGLISRLPAITKPRSPLNLSTSNTPRISNPVPTSSISRTLPPAPSTTKFVPSFDPSRLTADVQSKISSLDPVEHAKSTKTLSGYQMEFLKQISQPQTSLTSFKPRGKVTTKIGFQTQSWSARNTTAIPLNLLTKKESIETMSSSMTSFPTDLSVSTSSEPDSKLPKPSSLRSIRISTQEPAKRIPGCINLKTNLGLQTKFSAGTALSVKKPSTTATTSSAAQFEVINISSGSSPEEIHDD